MNQWLQTIVLQTLLLSAGRKPGIDKLANCSQTGKDDGDRHPKQG